MTMCSHARWLALVALLAAAPGVAVAADDWQAQVGEALGKTGSATPSGIYRVGLPRTDLTVALDGIRLRPRFRARRVARFPENGRSGDGDGRPGADHGRGEPGHEKALRGWYRGDGVAQPPTAHRTLHDVHACTRPRRPGETCNGASRCARRKQDATR